MSNVFNELSANGIIPEDNAIQNTNGYFDKLEKDDIAKCHKKLKKLKKKKKEYGYLKKKDKHKYKKLKKKMKKLKHDNEMSNQHYCQRIKKLEKENFMLQMVLISQHEDIGKMFQKMLVEKAQQDVEDTFIDCDAKVIN